MAAVITIAITLLAGSALFGYVNSEASVSENSLGQANAANVNYLDERFVVTDMSFGSNSVFLYLYNNGNVTLNLSEIVMYDAAGNDPGNGATNSLYVVFSTAPATGTTPTVPTSCGTVASPIVQSGTSLPSIQVDGYNSVPITLTAPSVSGQNCLASGTTYYIIVVGIYGSKVIYSACDSPSGECNS
jgi:hypothetical protein